MSKFIIEIETDNDAFYDNAAPEVCRILKQFIAKYEDGLPERVKLRDFNGNTVGFAEYQEEE
jgi:hypothetical protein